MTARSSDEGRSRGRPHSSADHDIPDALIRTLRRALETKSHSELTLKEIAAEAGTSQEMIRYYYGGKDGLITAMLLQSGRRVDQILSDLKARLETCSDNATHDIIKTLIHLYLSERAATRVAVLEYQMESSPLKDGYLTKGASIIIGVLHDIIVSLIERGVYRKTTNARHMALSMMVAANQPVYLLRALPPEWLTVGMLESDPWIDHLVSLFESQCEPQG